MAFDFSAPAFTGATYRTSPLSFSLFSCFYVIPILQRRCFAFPRFVSGRPFRIAVPLSRLRMLWRPNTPFLSSFFKRLYFSLPIAQTPVRARPSLLSVLDFHGSPAHVMLLYKPASVHSNKGETGRPLCLPVTPNGTSCFPSDLAPPVPSLFSWMAFCCKGSSPDLNETSCLSAKVFPPIFFSFFTAGQVSFDLPDNCYFCLVPCWRRQRLESSEIWHPRLPVPLCFLSYRLLAASSALSPFPPPR